MVRYLNDQANIVTALGLAISTSAIYLVMRGYPDLGVAVALWALLADDADGVIASRIQNRDPDFASIGKSLDGFADIIYGAMFPAIVIIQVNEAAPYSLLIACSVLLTGALRLSYFENHGLNANGYTLGIPLNYDLLMLSILFIARPLIPQDLFIIYPEFLDCNYCHIARLTYSCSRDGSRHTRKQHSAWCRRLRNHSDPVFHLDL